MSSVATRFQSARKFLDAFEESWRADHEEAMRCRDFEAFLAYGHFAFEYLDWLNRTWRESVFRGVEPVDPEVERLLHASFVRWLEVADRVTADMQAFEQAYGVVEWADKVRSEQSQARAILKGWTSPAPARSVGSRIWEVSEEEADELRALLDAPPGAPGQLKVEPKSLPMRDASERH
jgi:hypothetical protein